MHSSSDAAPGFDAIAIDTLMGTIAVRILAKHGLFVIHGQVNEPFLYSVTHVLSGRSVGNGFNSVDAAMSYAQRLSKMNIDWQSLRPSLSPSQARRIENMLRTALTAALVGNRAGGVACEDARNAA